MMHIPINNINKVVLRLPNWIGDAVMATPMLHALRALMPQAHITAIAPQHILELLQGLSLFDDVLVFRKGENIAIQADCGILLTGSFSSALQFFRSHIPIRIGFACHLRTFLLTHPIKMPAHDELHDVLKYMLLLSPFTQVTYSNMNLRLHVSDEEKRNMRARLKQNGIYSNDKLLLINPGAAYGEAKCWPKDYFKAVIEAVSSKDNIKMVIIGNQAVDTLAQELVDVAQARTISYAGTTTLRELMALLSLADCVLTNDSGPMHIAAACQTPLIALFGSTNPKRTRPWLWGHVLYENVTCSPCYRRTCPIDFRCMRQITPQKVLKDIFQVLGV